MDVCWIAKGTVAPSRVEELPALLARDDGFVWVDIPVCDDAATTVLAEVFGFHPLAVRDCQEQSRVPSIRTYADHLFIVLHAPESGPAGQVYFLELDQFIARRYLVTVHESPAAAVSLAALHETGLVRARIEAGRFCPGSTAELSYAIVSALARRLERFGRTLAATVAALEQRVMHGATANPEATLEELFRVRHELLTTRTMAAQNRETYAGLVAVTRLTPPEGRPFMTDLLDQFDRVRSLCDGEREFLQGVIDFYQTRTTTQMNIAMERLALIAAVLLPISTVASIYGMNVIVSEQTRLAHIVVVLIVMLAMAVAILQWAKRQGWW